jgi:hypothetical protein
MASYTNAGAPEPASSVVDLDLSMASGLLASRCRTSPTMTSFLKRTANASLVPRLLSDGAFYIEQWRVIRRRLLSLPLRRCSWRTPPGLDLRRPWCLVYP